MNGKRWLLAGFLLCALPVGIAQGDRVVLKNGSTVHGEIVAETDREVVILLAEGMRMTLERARIEKIVKDAPPPPPAEPEDPPPLPEPAEPAEPVGPSEEPAPPPDPAPPVPAEPSRGAGRVLFEDSAAANWEHTFSRHPSIRAARVVGFRAYEYVSHSLLRGAANDPRVEAAVRSCGRGGTLAAWKFKYVGMRELRFGDDVKFVAEILAPPGIETPAIALDGGPTPTAPRVQVILVRRDFSIRRYVTTTTFGIQDFKRQDLEETARRAMPVRTYREDYDPVKTTWLTPADSGFLDELQSTFGESFRTEMDRYRFRVQWFTMDPEDRPPLDAALLRDNAVRPLAAAGADGVDEDTVFRSWGTYEDNWKKFVGLKRVVLERFRLVGVEPGEGYYVERDLVGMQGDLGITIRTRKHMIPADLLEDLLRSP